MTKAVMTVNFETESEAGRPLDFSTARLFVVAAQFNIDPSHYAEFMTAIVDNARQSRQHEPGCLTFDVCADPTRSDQVFLYEVYRSEAAFEQHKRTGHFLHFQHKVTSWIVEKKVKLLNLVDGGVKPYT
jgi:quinol monooxygenase YgiN